MINRLLSAQNGVVDAELPLIQGVVVQTRLQLSGTVMGVVEHHLTFVGLVSLSLNAPVHSH